MKMTKDSLDLEGIIKSAMNHYLEEKGIPYDKANKKQLGKAFCEFYVRDIGAYLFQFDDDLIEDGLRCDGKDDLNIDFAYRNEDTFYIIQSKYKSKKKGSLDRDEILGFFGIHSNILDEKFLESQANETVRDILSTFTENSQGHYILLTNISISQNLRDQFNKAEREGLEKYGASQITWELKDFPEIKKDYKTAQSIDEPIPDKVTIPVERVPSPYSYNKEWAFLDLTDILDEETPYQTYLCTIKGTVLKNLYKTYKESLFNYNIRGYLGPNVINKRIIKTIKEEPKSFYLYNNGISAICSNLDIESAEGGKGLQLICKNFQVINGAQTTCCIGGFKEDEKLKDVRILLRITKTVDIKKEKKELNRKIIMYNNSQTIIKASDFRSNDEIQMFLEQKLRDYSYKASSPHKQLIYLPKRKKVSKRKEETYITMEMLTKILCAFNSSPTLIYENTKPLFDIDSLNGGKYWDIFGVDGEEVTFWPNDKIKETAAISILWLYVLEKLKSKEKQLRISKKENSTDYLSCLTKWHYLWAYAEIIRRLYPDDMPWIVNRLIDGKLFSKENNFVDIWFEEISGKIMEGLDSEILLSKEAPGSEDNIPKGFNFRNWLRNETCFKKLGIRFKRVTPVQFPLHKND
jgi:predicted DNA binding CopG/RHH family protein